MPRGMEGRRSEGAAGLAGKHEVLGTGRRLGGEMRLQVRHDDLWDRHGPNARVGLRWAEHERAVAKLLVLLDDRHRAVQQVEVDLAERTELADPQAAERGEQDHRPIPGFDGVGDRVDLVDRRHWPFGGTFHDAPLMTHGFGPRGHLRRLCRRWREQPVRLGGVDAPVRPASMRPALHDRNLAGVMSASSTIQRRKDVQSKQAAVDLPGARAQVRTVGESPAGVVGEWDFAAVQGRSTLRGRGRTRGGEPAVGDALVRNVSGATRHPTLDLVSRLPAPRRQSAGVPRGRRSTQRAWLERCGTTGRSRSRPTTCERSETII